MSPFKDFSRFQNLHTSRQYIKTDMRSKFWQNLRTSYVVMLIDHGPPRKKLDGTGLHKRADMISHVCFLLFPFLTFHRTWVTFQHCAISSASAHIVQSNSHSLLHRHTYCSGFLIAWALQVPSPSQTYPEDPRNFLTTHDMKDRTNRCTNGYYRYLEITGNASAFHMPAATRGNIGKPWKSFAAKYCER